MARTMWGEGRNPTGYTYAVIYSTLTGQPVTEVYRLSDSVVGHWPIGWTVDSRYAFMHRPTGNGSVDTHDFYILPNPELTSTKPRVKGGG